MFALRRTALSATPTTTRLNLGSGAWSSLSSLVSAAVPEDKGKERLQQQHCHLYSSVVVSPLSLTIPQSSSNVLSMVAATATSQWSYWWKSTLLPATATVGMTAVLEQLLVDTIVNINNGIYFISTLKRRRKMMNKHKLRKRRKKNRMKNKK